MAVLPGTGAGTFPSPFSYTAVGRIPSRAVVGDLNGDGLPDAVFTSGNSNGIGVMLNTSHGRALDAEGYSGLAPEAPVRM